LVAENRRAPLLHAGAGLNRKDLKTMLAINPKAFGRAGLNAWTAVILSNNPFIHQSINPFP
jgi:hypothetical protein